MEENVFSLRVALVQSLEPNWQRCWAPRVLSGLSFVCRTGLRGQGTSLTGREGHSLGHSDWSQRHLSVTVIHAKAYGFRSPQRC